MPITDNGLERHRAVAQARARQAKLCWNGKEAAMQGAGDGGDGLGHCAGTAKRLQCRALVTAAAAQGDRWLGRGMI